MNNNQNGKPQRHCMVVHAYYPLGETRVERQTLALIDQGIEVDVICLKKPHEPAEASENGAQVHRLPVRRHKASGVIVQMLEYVIFFVLAFFRITQLHRKRRFNTVQVHNLPDFLVFVALIPKFTGAKIILDLHDLMPEFYAERFQRSMDSLSVRLIRFQEWLSCNFAHHIITVTELWRQALIDRGHQPQKIAVVMNIADNRFFHPNVVTDLPDDDHFRVIYHGVMGRRHGLDLVLSAINRVRKIIPDIRFTLHGGGEYRHSLEKLADEMRLLDNVKFSYQFVPTEELAKWIKTAHLGVVPYRDGVFTGGILPTKLMEYAALGIPTIAARTPTINAYFDETMVEFFKPGSVEELTECILRLYRDRSRLTDLAYNISKFNEKYNWPDQSSKYVQLVEKLSKK
jgi:glycosyltransferase involved in cell wall biosynthesis